jgi:hypothetical protein
MNTANWNVGNNFTARAGFALTVSQNKVNVTSG